MDRPTLARVHWQDGMMLRSKHFELVEGRVDEMTRLTQRHLEPQAGICIGGEPILDCNLTGSQLTVTLESCVALVPDGRLLIVDATRAEAARPLSTTVEIDVETDANHPIGIEVMDGTDPVGTPDPDEDPPRIPYRLERIRLIVGDDPGLGRSSAIRIGEVKVTGGAAMIAADYIPPCVAIGASTKFTTAVERFGDRIKASGARALSGCKAMKEGLEREGIPNDPFFLILQQTASNLGLAREWLPATPYHDPPEAAFRPVRAALRSVLELFQIFPGAKNEVITQLVLTEKLPSGDQVFFESLQKFLEAPITRDDLREAVTTHNRYLEDVEGVVRFLSEGFHRELDTTEEFYEYRGVRYLPVPYDHKQLRKDENRQYLDIGGLKSTGDLKSVLVVMRCMQGTPEERERFVIRFGVNDRKTWIFADQVQVDATTVKNHIICLYPEVAEARVQELTLISGAVDFTPLENAPPIDLRIYGV